MKKEIVKVPADNTALPNLSRNTFIIFIATFLTPYLLTAYGNVDIYLLIATYVISPTLAFNCMRKEARVTNTVCWNDINIDVYSAIIGVFYIGLVFGFLAFVAYSIVLFKFDIFFYATVINLAIYIFAINYGFVESNKLRTKIVNANIMASNIIKEYGLDFFVSKVNKDDVTFKENDCTIKFNIKKFSYVAIFN